MQSLGRAELNSTCDEIVLVRQIAKLSLKRFACEYQMSKAFEVV